MLYSSTSPFTKQSKLAFRCQRIEWQDLWVSEGLNLHRLPPPLLRATCHFGTSTQRCDWDFAGSLGRGFEPKVGLWIYSESSNKDATNEHWNMIKHLGLKVLTFQWRSLSTKPWPAVGDQWFSQDLSWKFSERTIYHGDTNMFQPQKKLLRNPDSTTMNFHQIIQIPYDLLANPNGYLTSSHGKEPWFNR